MAPLCKILLLQRLADALITVFLFVSLPFIAGAIAQPHGVGSLQPFALALLVTLGILWLLLPRRPQHTHDS